MNDKPTEQTISDLPVITKFIYSIGVLPTSYKMSMTYEEQVVWLCNYLETTVIPAVNQNGEAVEELQNLYELLRTYVNDYFDNLDVQDEINQKLEVMADDGSLTALIKNYVDPYIDEQNTRIETMENSVNSINNKVNSVASGSPAGVYATVSDLETADPDHSKIYLVSANGNWYYYDTDSWTSGGQYQTTMTSTGSIKPFNTSFYDDINLYPKQNYVQGKILNVNNGTETTWNTGSYNQEYIEVDYTKTYIVINNSSLIYDVPTLYTYDEEKTFISYVRPNTDTKKYSVTFNEGVKYIRIGFWNINSPILATDSILIKLEDALKLSSYEKNYFIKNKNFNAIETNDIIMSNKYNFRLLPYQCVAAGSAYSTLHYPTIYEMKATNVAQSGSNFLGVWFDYDTSKLSVGDTIYVDTTGSSTFNNVALFATTSTASDTLIFTNMGNGIWKGVLTQSLITAMNNAKGTNNYYPRLIETRTGQIAGTTLTTNMRVWINEDFSNLTNYLNDVEETITTFNDKQTLSVIALGDSITALQDSRSWLTYFNDIQPIDIIQNVAVSGAHLMDYEDTVYDGNPVFNGPDNNHNNVLGNQVQKIINNVYQAPDIIMIAIGTNAGINCTEEEIYNSYYDSQGNLIPLQNVDRTTSTGAFRYCNETLRSLYPNATIFWCTPIQGHNSIRPLNNIITYGKNLKALTQYASVQCIDTEKCGITGYTEYNGSNGLYLIDGLHPNANGAKYMGYYNATKVKEYCESCKLLND